ncbi:MAG: DUF418 domain-containing protein [Bacteroidales bacterium]|nr:DUF418 domain-containing protein [Bacteroidales bacterium]
MSIFAHKSVFSPYETAIHWTYYCETTLCGARRQVLYHLLHPLRYRLLHHPLAQGHIEIVAVAVFVVELLLCRLWLHYFKFGPLEWIWRMLTYGMWLSLRKDK